MKKLLIPIILLLVFFMFSCTLDYTKPIETQPGTVFFDPPTIVALRGASISFDIKVNTGKEKVAAYGIKLKYDPTYIKIEKDKDGKVRIEAANEGFLAAANLLSDGELFFTGFDTVGKGPSENLHLVIVYFEMLNKKGTTNITLLVENLKNEKTKAIGMEQGKGLELTIK